MLARVAPSMTALEPWNRGGAGAGVVDEASGGRDGLLWGGLAVGRSATGPGGTVRDCRPAGSGPHAAAMRPRPTAAISNRRAWGIRIRAGIMPQA